MASVSRVFPVVSEMASRTEGPAMKTRSRSPFEREGRAGVRQLPASLVLAPATLTGNSVVNDLYIQQLTVTQRSTDGIDNAASFISAGPAYNGTLSRWVKNDGAGTFTSITTID